MIGGEHSVEVKASVDELWEFIARFENWAPYVIGFQELTTVSEDQTIWKLRGDVGILSREVDIQADVTNWQRPEKAEFDLTGITERLTGKGVIAIEPVAGSTAIKGPVVTPPSGAKPAAPSWFNRLLASLAARFIRRAHRQSAARGPTPATVPGSPTSSNSPAPPAGSDATTRSRLTITLELTPGGPMAPMLEMLMAPMLDEAARDFSSSIRRAIEGERDE